MVRVKEGIIDIWLVEDDIQISLRTYLSHKGHT